MTAALVAQAVTTRPTPPSTSGQSLPGSQNIAAAGDAVIAEPVRRRGRTTLVHDGHVTALNATVRYVEGTVHRPIETTAGAQGGDSGNPLFVGIAALGSCGGSGNCRTGGKPISSRSPTALHPRRERLPIPPARV